MGRLARVVATDVPHHLTQRGNGRRFVLDCDADCSVYINLLRENLALYKVSLIGYWLMSNHIHLIAVPRTADPEILPSALNNDGVKRSLFNNPKSFGLIEGQIGEATKEPLAFSPKFRQERAC
jgi:REP element-mobilizing transposase RayT